MGFKEVLGIQSLGASLWVDSPVGIVLQIRKKKTIEGGTSLKKKGPLDLWDFGWWIDNSKAFHVSLDTSSNTNCSEVVVRFNLKPTWNIWYFFLKKNNNNFSRPVKKLPPHYVRVFPPKDMFRRFVMFCVCFCRRLSLSRNLGIFQKNGQMKGCHLAESHISPTWDWSWSIARHFPSFRMLLPKLGFLWVVFSVAS